MKLILAEDGPLVFHAKNGFPVTRKKIEDATVLSYKFRPDGVSIPISQEFANEIPGTLLMQSGIKLDQTGHPILVPQSDPDALEVPAGAVLVSAAYNNMRPHLRFECKHKGLAGVGHFTLDGLALGVIYSYAPAVTENWSRRSFLAVMLPGTEISFVVQVRVRRLDSSCPDGYRWEQKEETKALLSLSEETGRLEYLFNELPFMDNSDNNWMNGLNRDADVEWKRALQRRRFG